MTFTRAFIDAMKHWAPLCGLAMTGSAGGAQAPEGPAPFAERAGGVDSGCGRLDRPVTEQVIGLATGGTLSCPGVQECSPEVAL
jgi:hypothetical protein